MCQIVEGHNIAVPRKSGGGREALFNNFQKKWGAQALLGPQFCHPVDVVILKKFHNFMAKIVDFFYQA